MHGAPWNYGMRIPHVEAATSPRQNLPIQSHTTTVARPDTPSRSPCEQPRFNRRIACSAPTSSRQVHALWIRRSVHLLSGSLPCSARTALCGHERQAEPLPRTRHPAEPSKGLFKRSSGRCRFKKSLSSHSAVTTGFSLVDTSGNYAFIQNLRPRTRVAENC